MMHTDSTTVSIVLICIFLNNQSFSRKYYILPYIVFDEQMNEWGYNKFIQVFYNKVYFN